MEINFTESGYYKLGFPLNYKACGLIITSSYFDSYYVVWKVRKQIFCKKFALTLRIKKLF